MASTSCGDRAANAIQRWVFSCLLKSENNEKTSLLGKGRSLAGTHGPGARLRSPAQERCGGLGLSAGTLGSPVPQVTRTKQLPAALASPY